MGEKKTVVAKIPFHVKRCAMTLPTVRFWVQRWQELAGDCYPCRNENGRLALLLTSALLVDGREAKSRRGSSAPSCIMQALSHSTSGVRCGEAHCRQECCSPALTRSFPVTRAQSSPCPDSAVRVADPSENSHLRSSSQPLRHSLLSLTQTGHRICAPK